jgi:fumarate reductase flavoprotein subunit
MLFLLPVVILLLAASPAGCAKDAPPPYIAGIYQGSTTGFGGPLRLETEFSEWAIINITILEHKEIYGGSAILALVQSALEQIPPAIIAKQSADVDGISGATYTSNAITGAVKICIEQARNSSAVLWEYIKPEEPEGL